MLTIAFVGEEGGKMAQLTDASLCAPFDKTNNIQKMHLAIAYILCGVIGESMP